MQNFIGVKMSPNTADYVMTEEPVAQQLEVNPIYKNSAAAVQRSQRRRQQRRDARQPVFYDCALASNTNYMTVIKESYSTIMRRNQMQQEKQRILNMDFRKKSDVNDWERLNKFIVDRRSHAHSEVIND